MVHVLDKVGIQERGVLDHRRVRTADELEARLVLVHAVEHRLGNDKKFDFDGK